MPASRSIIDKVPYKAVVETLPVQLAAGEGPDIARVTDLGGLNKFYLDLTPCAGRAREVLGGQLRPDASSGCAAVRATRASTG